jgi:hypothetical protein
MADVGHSRPHSRVRVYWFCNVFGEPGKELTPFAEISDGLGWEDDEPTNACPCRAGRRTTRRQARGVSPCRRVTFSA